jgi:tetratricopeptide (TPR) repeat protein
MIGQTISHYRITQQLGAGGMGVVYEAVDLNLDRSVALKFLPSDLTRDPEAKARFIHEAKAASALDHPNVCTVHEIGETDNGQLFLAMACYQGETLKERIARGPLQIDEAVGITRQIAEGLTKAHDQEIVHRDIKPANIFVTTDGLVKILDFGLAKLTGQTRLTQTGTTLGTVAYMPPEQARGEETDHRGDLWSLGCVLYEMVTGRAPFKGDHDQAVIYAILNEQPEPATAVRTGVPMELERIIGKCLAKDPNERFQSTAGVLADLTPMQKKLADGVMGTTAPVRIKTGRGIRWPWMAAICLVCMAVGIGAWTILTSGHDDPGTTETTLAIVEFRDMAAVADPVTSAMISELISTALIEASPVRVQSPEYLRDIRRRLFGAADAPVAEGQELEIAREGEATYLLTGRLGVIEEGRFVTWRLVDVGSGRSVDAGRAEPSKMSAMVDSIVADVLATLSEATEVTPAAAQVPVEQITTISPIAYEHYVLGMLAIEKQRYFDAARQFERAVQLDSTFAMAYYQLSFVYSGLGRGVSEYEKPRIYAGKAWEYRSRLGIKDRMRLEAWRYHLDFRVNEAVATYREMLARWPDDLQVIGRLSAEFLLALRAEECVEYCIEKLSLYPEDETLIWAYANSLAILGRPGEAIDLRNAGIRLNPEDTNAWTELGQFYLEMGEPDSAEVALHRALEIEPDNFYAMRYLSYCPFYRGDVQRAIALQEALLERHDLMSGQRIRILAGDPATPDLPVLYAEKGNFAKALTLFEQALADVPDHLTRLKIESRRGRLLLRMGRAEEVLARARGLLERSGGDDVHRMRLLGCIGLALVDLDSLDSVRSVVDQLEVFAARSGRVQERVIALRLSAAIALAEGHPDAALDALQEMNRLGMYRAAGPDNIEWREDVARAHRLAGRLDEAADIHEEILRTIRGHTLSHYDLGLIYEEVGSTGDAAREYSRFLMDWSDADEGLLQLEDARLRLAALRAGTY